MKRPKVHRWTKDDALAWLHSENGPRRRAGREDAKRLCRQLGATEAEIRAARRKDWAG